MACSRALTSDEKGRLITASRKLKARDRALLMAQLFLGFRISEVLALQVGHVLHNGQIRNRVSLPPRFLKGGYGGTRSVPVGGELRRTLENYLSQRSRGEVLTAESPLFLSRHKGSDGGAKKLCRSSAEKIVKRVLTQISPDDPQGLSSHSLRKCFAEIIYQECGQDLLCVRDALGHSSVAVTQVYLASNRKRIDAAILRCDSSRMPRRKGKAAPLVLITNAPTMSDSEEGKAPGKTETLTPSMPPEPMLPGFEVLAP